MHPIDVLIICSLENAGEGSMLPMLRSIRLVLRLFASGKSGFLVSSCSGVDAQVHIIFIFSMFCLLL